MALILRALLLITGFLIYIPASVAQINLGLEAGITSNSVKENTSFTSSEKRQSKLSYSFGLNTQFRINPAFSIVTLPSLVQKNYGLVRTDSLTGVQTIYENTYFQLPLMCHIDFGHKVNCFFEAGGYWAYWVKSIVKGNIADIFSAKSDLESQTFNVVSYKEKRSFTVQDKRNEFGYTGALGVSYPICGRVKLHLVSRYYFSLTNQLKTNSGDPNYRYNQTFALLIGSNISLR